MKYTKGHRLEHPETKELIGIFEGYTEDGQETWKTENGIEHITFYGFAREGGLYVVSLWKSSAK